MKTFNIKFGSGYLIIIPDKALFPAKMYDLQESMCCGYSLERHQRDASNKYPEHTFLWRI